MLSILEAMVVGVLARLGVVVLGLNVDMLSVLLCLAPKGRSSRTNSDEVPSLVPAWVFWNLLRYRNASELVDAPRLANFGFHSVGSRSDLWVCWSMGIREVEAGRS